VLRLNWPAPRIPLRAVRLSAVTPSSHRIDLIRLATRWEEKLAIRFRGRSPRSDDATHSRLLALSHRASLPVRGPPSSTCLFVLTRVSKYEEPPSKNLVPLRTCRANTTPHKVVRGIRLALLSRRDERSGVLLQAPSLPAHIYRFSIQVDNSIYDAPRLRRAVAALNGHQARGTGKQPSSIG